MKARTNESTNRPDIRLQPTTRLDQMSASPALAGGVHIRLLGISSLNIERSEYASRGTDGYGYRRHLVSYGHCIRARRKQAFPKKPMFQNGAYEKDTYGAYERDTELDLAPREQDHQWTRQEHEDDA
jgi:hypothetical protein